MMTRWQRAGLLAVLVLLFFGSGVSSLIYQVLWLRTLGWVFGVTVYAATTVWATFMAGLAAGSFVAGRIGDRVRSPLRWFGAAEMLIGLTALATPWTLALLQRLYADSYASLPHSLGALTAIRFGMAFIALIVPTALMGATLPLVVKASESRGDVIGGRLGLLYGSNAAGAIVGTIAAGLFFIPGRGIQGTFLLAAALNLLIGTGAIVLSLLPALRRPPPETSVADAADPAREPAALSARQSFAVLAVFGISGLVSMALEVVWFRVLTLFLRPTVYGFAVMLATILAGVAIGSYLATPLLKRVKLGLPIIAGLELLLGVVVVLSFGPLTYLSNTWKRLTPVLSHVMPEYLIYPVTGSLLAIFPTALLMGIAFPIGLHLWATRGVAGGGTARRIGSFYSLNVGGSILGSLAAGFLLLPLAGSYLSLVLLASISFASGLLLLAVSPGRSATRALAGIVATAFFAAALMFSPDPFVEFVAQRYPGQEIVSREEGVEATVVVHKRWNGELSLTVNGNHEASTGGPMVYVHRRIGHLPMVVHPNARTALVIGLGGGATAGAVSMHGAEVDVVELAGAVVRGAKYFDAINYGVLSRPNVRLRVDDGRNYLMLTPRRYDVVTADVIIPIFAGSGNLYSAEYFRLMRRVLNPGGMVLQWVSGTEAEYKMIARTFLSVFPETTAWADGGLLIGRLEPLRLRKLDFDWKLNEPGRLQGMKDLNITTYEQLLASFTAGPEELRAFVGDGPLLTDDRPLVEYFLSLPRGGGDIDLSGLKGDVSRYAEVD